MTDQRLAEAIGNWRGRFLENGVVPSDYDRVTSSITEWSQWLGAWSALGQVQFLDRGLATFAVDGPGQGEAEYDLPIRPEEGNHNCMNLTYRHRPKSADWMAAQLLG